MNGLGLAGTAAGSRQGSSLQSHAVFRLQLFFSLLSPNMSTRERGVADRPPWHGTEFDGLLRIRYVQVDSGVFTVAAVRFETLVFHVACT